MSFFLSHGKCIKGAKDEDGNGAEIYIRENSPWTLVKKYALTEKEAENNTDLILKNTLQ